MLPLSSLSQLQQFRDEFQTIDRSHCGSICLRDFTSSLNASDLVSSGSVDLRTIFRAISVESSHGHGADLTYHEYIAAVMHSRVDVNENRLSLIYSYLDPGQSLFF